MKQDLTVELVLPVSQPVGTVPHINYLGSFLYCRLGFAENTDYVSKKRSQRLFKTFNNALGSPSENFRACV